MSRFKTAPVANKSSDWEIVRRNSSGTQVRYQNRVTTKMTGWCASPEFIAQNAAQTLTVTALPETLNPLAHIMPTSGAYSRMTVAELKSLAGDRGIKVPSKARKSEIISALMN